MSDFSGLNRDLYSMIKALYEEESLSYRAVTQSLQEEGLLPFIGDDKVEGEGYLRELVSLADSQGIKHHVNRIEERSVRNSLREVAALIAAEANDDARNIQEIMDEAERRIFTLRRRKRDEEGQSMGDIIRAYLPFIDGLRSGEIQPAWINQDIGRFPTPNFNRAHRFDTYQEARAKRSSQHYFILTIEEAQDMIELFKVGGRSLIGYSHGSISSKDLRGR